MSPAVADFQTATGLQLIEGTDSGKQRNKFVTEISHTIR